MTEALRIEDDPAVAVLEAIHAQKHAPHIAFADASFPAQADFVNDAAHLLALLCTRRAGKSLGLGRKLYKTAYEKPGCSCLYIALTRDSAKKIMWKDVLKPLAREFFGKGKVKFNETELTATLPNGSIIYLLGVDSDEEQKQKLLGQKYAGVAIDEAASFTIDLCELVYRVVDPATVDLDGWVALTGTPGNLKRGLFFDLTSAQIPTEPGRWQKKHADPAGAGAGEWSGHRWSTLQNPYMREKWIKKIAQLKAANESIEQTPGFQQEYCGVWVIDDENRIYRYRMGRNDFAVLPVYPKGEWHHLLAVDLGHTDAASFQVLAYHDHDPNLYLLLSYKKPGMDFTDVANHSKALDRTYEFEAWIIDGANKQGVEEMRKRHQCPWRAADKTAKFDFIDLMNADFIAGLIKIGPECGPLREEYDTLVLDPKKKIKGERAEHPSCPNHCADGALYGWRYAYPYLSERLKERPAPGSPAALQDEEDAMEAAAEEQYRQEHEDELQGWAQ